MKFKSQRNLLLQALNRAGLVSGARTTLPILNHVLVKAEREFVHFVGHNLAMSIETSVAAEVKTKGSVCLPAKRLAGYINLLDSDEVEFELKETRVRVGFGKQRSDMTFLPADEFVEPFKASGQSIEIPAVELLSKLNQIKFAQCTDETRPIGCGVCFWFDPLLDLVATNFKLVAIAGTSLKGEGQSTVPSDLIDRLLALLKDQTTGTVTPGTVMINLSETACCFSTNSWTIGGNLIEGRLAMGRKVVETKLDLANHKPIIVNREQLLRAVRQCQLFINPNLSPRMTWECSKDSLKISAGDESSSFSELDCKGFDLKIVLPTDNLISILSAIKGQDVTIMAKDNLSPIKIEEDQFMVVMTPMVS